MGLLTGNLSGRGRTPNALKTYRDRYVRDTQGGLVVDGRRVRGFNDWVDYDFPLFGALFVRASAESK